MGNTFDPQALIAFIAVADQGSFSLAAEQLFLTQPAISKRISTLEEQLGHRLFDRIGRQISLTQAGRLLYQRSQTLLNLMEDTRRELDNLNVEVKGNLHLATSHHIGLHRLPPLLKAFSHSYPEVKLQLQFGESEKVYEQVLQGQVEIGIITLAPDPDPRLLSTPVWQDQLHFVSASDHPAAGCQSLQQLCQYDAILPDSGTFTRLLLERLFQQRGLQLQLGLHTNNLDTLRMMVEIGLGWSLLPATLCQGLQLLPLLDPPLSRELGYIRHQERSQSSAAQAFIRLIKQHQDRHLCNAT
ncbi:LysR family transcriptional regulator [Balneatrix alpica]|uniref:LysR family transcriptional regulator n=1 Tax=Balneatrix alpica TaxID=75684 RepID=A0ABV5Z7Z3_9GAMM|nr:LysR family transcriptional regulator [Balneatrix alpica]